MTVYARDVSNYTDPLTPEVLAQWKAEGVGLVVVQAVDPPAGYPPGKTREQIQACLDAGLAVDAYIWLWFDLDVSDIQRKLHLLDGLPIRALWLDVEDLAASKYDQATCEAKVQTALTECDLYPTAEYRTGIYTGRWYWIDRQYMGDSLAFANRELWDSQYDGIPDAGNFLSYGGWTSRAIKQFAGSQPDGTDLNVLSEEEAASLATGTSTPDTSMDATCAAIKAACDRGTQRLWIEAAKKTTVSKKIIKEIADEMYAALQT